MTGLSDNEKEEMKALQDERKATGGHMSDSSRIRLSELQNREAEGKAAAKEDKKEPATAAASSTGGFGGGGKK